MRIYRLHVCTAALAFMLSGCGGGESAVETLADEAPSASAPAAAPLPDPGAPVAAGRYRSTLLQPPLSVTVPEGFTILTPETAGSITFGRTKADGGLDAVFAVLRPTRVVDPAARLVDGKLPQTALVPVPDDLISFFASHPGFDEAGRGTLEVDGATVMTIDTAVRAVETSTCDGAKPNCLSVFAVGPQTFTAESPMLIRNYVVPSSAGTLVIGMLAFDPAQSTALFAAGDEIVKSIDIS